MYTFCRCFHAKLFFGKKNARLAQDFSLDLNSTGIYMTVNGNGSHSIKAHIFHIATQN